MGSVVRQILSIALVASAAPTWASARGDEALSFVVLGHLRSWESGRANALLDDALSQVERLDPDLVFLVGDSIWGDVMLPVTSPEVITADWERLDSRLGELGVPVYRVPGNHDIHDPVTRDVYLQRYGPLPRAVRHGDCLFLLVNSAFVPAGDQPTRKYITTRRLAAEQVEFIRRQLDSTDAGHVFVFMHHVLWWQPDAPWWSEVHPLLVDRRVQGVFSGDLGPTKFSRLERDGIVYVRTAIEDDFVPDHPGWQEALQASVGDFLLSQQFDNLVHVLVDGEAVEWSVHGVGVMSSGKHSPEFWQAVRGRSPVIERWDWDPAAQEDETLIAKLARHRRRLIAVGVLGGACFLAGALFGARWSRSRAANPDSDR